MGVWIEIKLHWGNLRPKLRWPIALVASAMLVAMICKLDSARQRSNETALALRWARQVATQAETLSLSASERGEVDPLAWAARILSQGTDSKIIFAQKFRPQEGVSNRSSENYEFDAVTGILDYTKVLFPEDSAGIRIKLYVARTGVFGAKTLFAQDVTIAILFGLFLCLFVSATKERGNAIDLTEAVATSAASPSPPPPPPPPSNEWMAGFKQALVELGKDIREMTRSAQKLSSSAIEAREKIAIVKAKLEDSASPPADPSEMASLAKEAQALFATATPETKTLVRKLLQVTIQKASETDRIKKTLEEISANSDAAFDALKDVSDHTREMSAGITKTTSGVMAVRRSAP